MDGRGEKILMTLVIKIKIYQWPFPPTPDAIRSEL
jgi:hypothetical protein